MSLLAFARSAAEECVRDPFEKRRFHNVSARALAFNAVATLFPGSAAALLSAGARVSRPTVSMTVTGRQRK